MFSRIRERVTYTNVVLTLALVFAMSGGAYAAGHYLITSTKQISPKVLKALKGANGTNGAPGTNGPAGPAGPQGPQGPAGEKGTNGTNGTNGVSITSKTLKNGEGGCAEGGSEFTSSNGKTSACNGSPWTAGGTLPKGKTETGDFNISAEVAEFGRPTSSVSFNIPLAAPLTQETHVHFIQTNGKEVVSTASGVEEVPASVDCKGSATSPTAASGSLCVYASAEVNEAVGPTGLHNFGNVPLPTICPLAKGGTSISCILGRSAGEYMATDSTGFGIATAAAAAGPVEVAGSWAVTG